MKEYIAELDSIIDKLISIRDKLCNYKPGDVNNDGKVNIQDLTSILNILSKSK